MWLAFLTTFKSTGCPWRRMRRPTHLSDPRYIMQHVTVWLSYSWLNLCVNRICVLILDYLTNKSTRGRRTIELVIMYVLLYFLVIHFQTYSYMLYSSLLPIDYPIVLFHIYHLRQRLPTPVLLYWPHVIVSLHSIKFVSIKVMCRQFRGWIARPKTRGRRMLKRNHGYLLMFSRDFVMNFVLMLRIINNVVDFMLMITLVDDYIWISLDGYLSWINMDA